MIDSFDAVKLSRNKQNLGKQGGTNDNKKQVIELKLKTKLSKRVIQMSNGLIGKRDRICPSFVSSKMLTW